MTEMDTFVTEVNDKLEEHRLYTNNLISKLLAKTSSVSSGPYKTYAGLAEDTTQNLEKIKNAPTTKLSLYMSQLIDDVQSREDR